MTLATHIASAQSSVRPEFHFTPQYGWMNDPNGLVYFEGEYHLFYQYFPDGLEWGPMHWGHAVSTDLVHWEHLDTALFPDEQGMCFSGSAVVDHHNNCGLFDDQPGLLAFYTVHRITGDGKEDYVQEQCLAFSKDKGRTWEKYAGNPIIPAPEFRDFRDPKITWHEASGAWIMSVACGQSIRFYRSPNFIDWEFTSEFGEGQGAHTPGPWECPDLFELPVEGGEGSRWVLIVGVGAGDDDWGSFTQYFLGEFDGYKFNNENAADKVLLVDQGRDFYAVQSWSDVPDGRRLAIAWANNWLYADQLPESGWRGMMTLPREIRLQATPEGPRLAHEFAAEVHNIIPSQVLDQSAYTFEAGDKWEAPKLDSQTSCIHTSFELDLSDDADVDICLSGTLDPVLSITKNELGYQVVHLRQGSHVSERFDRYFPSDFSLPSINKDKLRVELFYDHGILEMLFDGGIYSITSVQAEGVSLSENIRKLGLVVKKGKIALDNRTIAPF
ncbi:MAG: glycoside hydrolase family 32 protein [Neptuniibacter sp.]